MSFNKFFPRFAVLTFLLLCPILAQAAELEAILLDQSATIFTDRFPEKDFRALNVNVPRNSRFGLIMALRTDAPAEAKLKVDSIISATGKRFTGNAELRNLFSVLVEGNTQGSCCNYPNGKFPEEWAPYLIRKAPFEILEAVDNAPHQSISLKAGRTGGVLLQIAVPSDAEAGKYSGSVRISAAGKTVELPFSFTVFSTVLPESYAIDSIHWLWPEPENLAFGGSDVKWWSEEHWKSLAVTASVLRESGESIIYTPTIFGTHPLISTLRAKDGTYHFDFSNFKRWLRVFSAAGYEKFAGHHLHSWIWSLEIIDEDDGKKRTIPISSEERFAVLEAFLPKLHDVLQEQHLEKSYWQFVMDEPKQKSLELYGRYSDLCRKSIPGLTLIDALNKSPKKFSKYADVIVMNLMGINSILGGSAPKPFPADKKPWLYSSTSPYPPYPNRHLDRRLIENRLWPILSVRYGASGYLNWAANIYRGVKNEYTDGSLGPMPNGTRDPGHPPGDCWFFYRGPHGLRTGLRMLNFRDGLVDATLLTQLKQVSPGRAAQLLETILTPEFANTFTAANRHKELREKGGYMKLAKYVKRSYSQDAGAYNDFRGQILKQLQKNRGHK